MSTSAIYGHRENNEDHIFFRKFDGYPSRLGVEIANTIMQPNILGFEMSLDQVFEYELDYGYIANHDKKVLEFYGKASKRNLGTGRFAGSREVKSPYFADPDKFYTCFGLALVKEIPFAVIEATKEANLISLFTK